MATLKYSRQREAIKQYLANTKAHPTADTVYMHIREENPNISLGTVYRNLNLLTDLGEVMKISCADGSDRFDGNPKPHYHFHCKVCGRVDDLEMELFEQVDEVAKTVYPGRIEGHILSFYGVCAECCKNEKR